MTTSVSRKGKVVANCRDSLVWRCPGRAMPAKVSVTSSLSMARPRGTCRGQPLNSCRRGSQTRRVQGVGLGPPQHIPGRGPGAVAGAGEGGKAAAGLGAAGPSPGWGHAWGHTQPDPAGMWGEFGGAESPPAGSGVLRALAGTDGEPRAVGCQPHTVPHTMQASVPHSQARHAAVGGVQPGHPRVRSWDPHRSHSPTVPLLARGHRRDAPHGG